MTTNSNAGNSPVDRRVRALPKPFDIVHDEHGRPRVLFTAEQMREYADGCAAEEREACKKICADHADAAEERGGTEDDGAIMAHMIWREINERSNAIAQGREHSERPAGAEG